MKNRTDEHGDKVRVFEKGDGMRRRYRAALDPVHAEYPSRSKLNHPIGWFLDGHLANRPVYGLYSLATLAEYFLHHAKYGKRNQSRAIVPAMEFFAATRRAMQNALDNYPIDERVRNDKSLASLRSVCLGLVELGIRASEAMAHDRVNCECPACRGKSLSQNDADLLSALLLEQSENGTIPRTSALFRVAT